MSLVVGTNTWITEADADTYFLTRLGALTYWKTGTAKEAALVTAYNQLNASSKYSFPTTVALITAGMKNGQCEQALYLLMHLQDQDKRLGLQVQGVSHAGVVQEDYTEDRVSGKFEVSAKIPISPIAADMLQAYAVGDTSAVIMPLERDEDEDVDYDAAGNE